MEDRVYSMDELAWAFRCPHEEAVRLCQSGAIRSFRIRGCYYVREGAIVEYLIRRHRTQERKRAAETGQADKAVPEEEQMAMEV